MKQSETITEHRQFKAELVTNLAIQRQALLMDSQNALASCETDEERKDMRDQILIHAKHYQALLSGFLEMADESLKGEK